MLIKDPNDRCFVLIVLLFTVLLAIKMTCDWFVANYDAART